jgi:hypothetical protein
MLQTELYRNLPKQLTVKTGRLHIRVDDIEVSSKFVLNKFFDMVYISLTVRSRLFLEKPVVAQLFNNFSVLYERKRTGFTRSTELQGLDFNILYYAESSTARHCRI